MTGYLSDKALRILANGFDVVPIKPGTKAPDFKGWENGHRTSEREVKRWMSNGRADYGLGIPTTFTPCADLDVRDRDCLRHMRDYIETYMGWAPCKIGSAPKRAYIFKLRGNPFAKISSKIYTDPAGNKAQIEILANGQQTVIFAIHPDTKKPYRWIGSETPETVQWDALPELTEEKGGRIVAEFERWCEEQGWQRRRSPGSTLPAPVERDRPGFIDPDDIHPDSGEPCGLDEDEIRAELMAIPNDEAFDAREDWVKIGCAVHHETGGNEFGHDLWLEWSEQHPSHDPALFEKAWNSFGKRSEEFRGITFRYVLKLAKPFKKAALAEQLKDLIERMDWARTVDELKDIAAECRKLDVDLLDRQRLMTALQKSMKSVANVVLGVREAREMVRFRPDDTAEWLDGWCYLKHAKQFFNRKTREIIDREAFDAAFSRFAGDSLPSHIALTVVKIPVFHMTIYLPGQPDEFTDEFGLQWINTYSDAGLPAMPAIIDRRGLRDVEIIEQHGHHLFSNPRDVAILHSVIAYIVQTNKRVGWATLVQGAEAIGKTTYAFLASAVLGQRNIYIVMPDTLQSGFTAWAEGKQIIFIEELRQIGHSRFDTPDKMKAYITNWQIEVNPKRINPYNVPNTATYILATNHRDALPILSGDTRYFVMISKWQTKEAVDAFKAANPEYFRNLYGAIGRSAGSIRKWLNGYKLHPDFDPNGRAPESAGRKTMIEEGKSEGQFAIEDLIRDGTNPLVSNDVLIVHELRESIMDEMGSVPAGLEDQRGIAHALRGLGFTPINRIRIDSARHFVWSRNHEIINASPATVKRLIIGRKLNTDL